MVNNDVSDYVDANNDASVYVNDYVGASDG
jgi:hypothetical protein